MKDYNMTPRVYVAGKLNSDAVGYIRHMHRMAKWAEKVKTLGCSVYVPFQDILMGLIHDYESYGDYFDNSQPWLMVADALFLVPGWETSVGSKKEIRLALSAGLAIFDDIDLMKKWVEWFADDDVFWDDFDISTEYTDKKNEIISIVEDWEKQYADTPKIQE